MLAACGGPLWLLLRCLCLVEEQGGRVRMGPALVTRRLLRRRR